jgi:hypothetical protein
MAGAPFRLSDCAGRDAYFGLSCGLPPGTPGGGMTGMLLPFEGRENSGRHQLHKTLRPAVSQ